MSELADRLVGALGLLFVIQGMQLLLCTAATQQTWARLSLVDAIVLRRVGMFLLPLGVVVFLVTVS